MLEATTDPALRAIAQMAHIQRAQEARRLVRTIRAAFARRLPGQTKRATPAGGPSKLAICAA